MTILKSSMLHLADSRIDQAEIALSYCEKNYKNLIVGANKFSLDLVKSFLNEKYDDSTTELKAKKDCKSEKIIFQAKYFKIIKFLCHESTYTKALFMREIILDNIKDITLKNVLQHQALYQPVVSLYDNFLRYALFTDIRPFASAINAISSHLINKTLTYEEVMREAILLGAYCNSGLNEQDINEISSKMNVKIIDNLTIETAADIIGEIEKNKKAEKDKHISIVDIKEISILIKEKYDNIIVLDSYEKAFDELVHLDSQSKNSTDFSTQTSCGQLFNLLSQAKKIIFIYSVSGKNNSNYNKILIYLTLKLNVKKLHSEFSLKEKSSCKINYISTHKEFPAIIGVQDLETLMINPYIFYAQKILKIKIAKLIADTDKQFKSYKKIINDLVRLKLLQNEQGGSLREAADKIFIEENYIDVIVADYASDNIVRQINREESSMLEVDKKAAAPISFINIYASADVALQKEGEISLYFYSYKSVYSLRPKQNNFLQIYPLPVLSSIIFNKKLQFENKSAKCAIKDISSVLLGASENSRKSLSKTRGFTTIEEVLNDAEEQVKNCLNNYAETKKHFANSDIFEKYQHKYAHLARKHFIES